MTRNDLLVSLNVGCYSGAGGDIKETTAWGDMLADTIKHIAKAISLRYDVSPVEAQHEILSRCTESLAQYTKHFSGALGKDIKDKQGRE
ncbi:MAG TPA: DUF5076 domain-containing protein [Rhodanobacteraceae bacterium]|nr:DUF5076 domain-containing protein [Rhodanobacteraceae bacterium]